jgi:ribosomal-protein-alanine acetyltransferase
LLIRPATAADIPAMMALEKHAATAAHWSRKQYEAAFESDIREVLVLEEGSAAQGFLVGRRVDDEWEIENVAIAGPARRRGLGTRLVGEFLNRARSGGAQSVYLEVRESNLAARLLYEKWAFVESGRRKSYYRDPEEDAVLYRLDFP